MAARAFTAISGIDNYNNCTIGQWAGVLSGDTCTAKDVPLFADKTVQITGTWGAGSTITINGSLDGVTYQVLNDPQGNALSFASGTNRIEAILENTVFIKPVLTGGDGTTNLNILILAR